MALNKKCRLALFCMLCALFCAAATLRADTPLKILFIGNSFTNGGPIPEVVRDLALDAGWAGPDVRNTSVSGKTLEFHSTYIPTLNAIDEGGWDYVVLQEYSTRPTDNIGDPEAFKVAATFLYDRVKLSSPGAQIILYETWARHEDHSFYPDTFIDRDEMQEQLNFHYHDCADNYIPANSTAEIKTDVTVAPAGEAWHANYLDQNIMLHGDDLYHANNNGQYLSSMAIYSTIYQCMVAGLSPLLEVSESDAGYLQIICDTVTGQVGGGPVAIEDVIAFFYDVVDAGLIIATPSNSPKDNLVVFEGLLLDAEDFINEEDFVFACKKLERAYDASDGIKKELIKNAASSEDDLVGELNAMIADLMAELGC